VLERALELAGTGVGRGASTLELTDARVRDLAFALELGAQLGGGALQREDALLHPGAAVADGGEARGEQDALLLGLQTLPFGRRVSALGLDLLLLGLGPPPLGLDAALLGARVELLGALAVGVQGDTRVVDASLQPIELGAVSAALARHVLLGLDAELLLGVLALLDAAQLVLAIGELLDGALALALGLRLAAAQVCQLMLERVHRRLGHVCTPELCGLAGSGSACAALGEHVVFELARGSLAGRCLVVSLGNHAPISVCARSDTSTVADRA
jgi:hypothetical protein